MPGGIRTCVMLYYCWDKAPDNANTAAMECLHQGLFLVTESAIDQSHADGHADDWGLVTRVYCSE